MALCKSERRTEMKREVLLLGDPALYEVSAAVTRGELSVMLANFLYA